MEQRYLKRATIFAVLVTIIVTFGLATFPEIHNMSLKVADSRIAGTGTQSVFDLLKESEIKLEDNPSKVVIDEMKGHQFRIELPFSVEESDIRIESDYVNKTYSIIIDGLGKDYFENYQMIGKCDNIMDVTYTSEGFVGTIVVTLDDVKEMDMVVDDDYAYFDLVDPHELYDYVVVVDAGHGGNVPGAYKMGVSEKDIDLAIVLQLKELFDNTDKSIGVYYTRTTDCNPSFANRVALPNDIEADLYLSVHNNSTASGRMSKITGTQVMYRGADPSGKSKDFAQLCLGNLITELESKDKGTVVGDEIYIIRESKAPVALAEIGFMTNEEELAKLNDEAYQKKAAKALYDSVVEFLYNPK